MGIDINHMNNIKNIVGRPTLYEPDILNKVSSYLSVCNDSGEGKNIKVNLPKVEGLASFLGVNKDTLYEWAKRYPEFSDALRIIKNEQYCRLIDEGLAGRYNSAIVKLMLSVNHGLSEVRTVDSTYVPPLSEEEQERMLGLINGCESNLSIK